jgi:hypothetical protein
MEQANGLALRGTERDRVFEAMLRELGAGERGDRPLAELTGDSLARRPSEIELEDIEASLFAAYDALTEKLRRTVAAHCDRNDEWHQQVRTGLEALLEELSTQPPIARALACSFPAISPIARLRYEEFLESFTRPMSGGRSGSTPEAEPPGELEMLAIEAAESIIRAEIEAGRAALLPSMTPPILQALLAPFGVEAAEGGTRTGDRRRPSRRRSAGS